MKRAQLAQAVHNWLNGYDSMLSQVERREIAPLVNDECDYRTLTIRGAEFMAENHPKYRRLGDA